MVLNLLRVEEINPEYMLEKSFYQFQHYRAIPGVVESKWGRAELVGAGVLLWLCRFLAGQTLSSREVR